MNMKKILCMAVASMLLLSTLTTSSIVKEKSRVKKFINYAKYVYSTAEYDNATNSNIISRDSDITDVSGTKLAEKVKEFFTNVTTTAKVPMITFDMSIYSAKFNDCIYSGDAVRIESNLFQKFPNKSVFVPSYNMMFDRSNHLARDDVIFICASSYKNYTGEEKFSTSSDTVSIICVGISSACIILHIIMFIFVKRLRNLPGYCLMSLCVALLSAYLVSFIQFEVDNQTNCIAFGMFLLYFFLASFFWMNAMSYDVWRSIRLATNKLRLTADRPIMVRFARYSVYAWGLPLMIIIIAIIVHNTTSNIKYTLIFNSDNCWFRYKQTLTVYFVIPLFSLLGINVIFFISSFYMIITASISKSQSELWSRLYLSLRLSSVMGFMWIFALIAVAFDILWLWYLYSICNALQGVFIFFSFTMSERTRKTCMKAFKERKFSRTPTQSSSRDTTTI